MGTGYDMASAFTQLYRSIETKEGRLKTTLSAIRISYYGDTEMISARPEMINLGRKSRCSAMQP